MAEGKSSDAGKVAVGAGIGAAALWLATRKAKASPDDAALLAIIQQINQVALRNVADIQSLDASATLLKQQVDSLIGVTMKQRELIPFRQTLAIAGAAGSGARLQSDVSLDGFIKEVKIHWPPGCNALVDVAVWYSTAQFLPREGFLALDAVTPTYLDLNIPVAKNRPVYVVMQNRDGANPHIITVTIAVEGVP